MTEIQTSRGTVRGSETDGIHAFWSIPYAAPPVGDLRFAAPEPPKPWEGVRDATEPGPTAPHAGYAGPIGELLPNRIADGEDHLTVNVWTPDPSASLPVMVFVHGGAFLNGSGTVDGYAGTSFARDGVVLVTLNYRLGAAGFAWVDGAAPNRGLLDQVAALEWVRDEIAAFGGDPSSVTVFGESAGAMSVGCLLAMPSARGLFSRAILESGAADNAMTPKAAAKSTARLADELGVEPTRAALSAVPDADIVRAQTTMRMTPPKEGAPPPGLLKVVAAAGMPFQPVVDGTVLPERPIDAIAAGSARDVEVLVGSNREEVRVYLVPGGTLGRTSRWDLRILAALTSRSPRRLLKALRAHLPHASDGDLASALLTERIFAAPARRLAEAHGGARVYEFAWRSPACDGELGACHALELAFVFDLVDLPSYGPLTGHAGPQDLATEMHGAWVDFAKGTTTDWPTYPHVRRFGDSEIPAFDGAAFDSTWRG